MKKFWKKKDGFTLVELIVVIAILGILAGVGTVGYSGYIKKANEAADQQLLSSINNAVELAKYSGEKVIPGYVSVDKVKTEVYKSDNTVGNTFLENAMEKAFGANWRELKLKAEPQTSVQAQVFTASNNFNTHRTEMLSTMDNLRGALSGVLSVSKDVIGNGFAQFLSDNNVADDNVSQANAAALYVAGTISNAEYEDSALSNILATANTPDDMFSAFNNLYGSTNGTAVAALASVYAVAQGFALENDVEFSPTFDDSIKTPQDAMDDLNEAFAELATKATKVSWADYQKGNAITDLKAFTAAMNAMDDSSDYLLNQDLTSESFYTDAEGLLNNYISTGESGGSMIYVK